MSKAELKDFTFKSRHIGPTNEDEASMLQYLGFENSEEFISSVIPSEIFDSENNFVSIESAYHDIDWQNKLNLNLNKFT